MTPNWVSILPSEAVSGVNYHQNNTCSIGNSSLKNNAQGVNTLQQGRDQVSGGNEGHKLFDVAVNILTLRKCKL